MFDHTLLVAEDDPHKDIFEILHAHDLARVIIVEATGCEAFAKMIFDSITVWLEANGYTPRVRVAQVEVREHGANSAVYVPVSQ